MTEALPLATIKLKYIKHYKDRLGTERYYFNKIGRPRTALPGLPGSTEFMQAYQECIDALPAQPATPKARASKGSISDLVSRYYASSTFKNLAGLTQSSYRNEIKKIDVAYGKALVSELTRLQVKRIIASKAEKPGAANKLLRTLRMLMKFAIDEEMRKDDPTASIKPLRVAGDGFIAWTESDIEKFEKHHPVGSMARLAFALALYTAQRRGDVVRMGSQHVREGKISVRQQKTGAYLDIPIHPDLAVVLAAIPNHQTKRGTNELTFVLSETGKPYAPASFGNWFGNRCREAGLPAGYNAHGLRKAGARRLAEAGCTTLEIMSITGHQTIAEVERYTRSANQAKMAVGGMAKLRSRSN
ncbi:tyrosine-type recombinase/integrase [Devosia naphthalenivorans]|uniref:tyrosine-type recombinase/integrase n=1 Tax=Devosia naphthalenivorans TaxID=2082392 RepID=UPI000D3BE8E5|nr:tyrosine-type recombinase/integrase [Devosia naphthalenivorans]